MRHSGIVNLSKSNFIKAVTKNNIAIFLVIFYVIGIIIGVISLANSDKIFAFAVADFEKFFDVRNDSDFSRIFFNSFLENLPFTFLIFICGTSLIGVTLIPLTLIFRGFQYGILSGFLYKELSLSGIALNSLIIIPTTLVCFFGYLFIAKQAFNFSLHLAKLSVAKTHTATVYSDFKSYSVRFLLGLIFFIFAALLDAVMCVSFIRFFNF